jgi:hypothetical protein
MYQLSENGQMNSCAKSVFVVVVVLFFFLTPYCNRSKVAAPWIDIKSANVVRTTGTMNLQSTTCPFTSATALESKLLNKQPRVHSWRALGKPQKHLHARPTCETALWGLQQIQQWSLKVAGEG